METNSITNARNTNDTFPITSPRKGMETLQPKSRLWLLQSQLSDHIAPQGDGNVSDPPTAKPTASLSDHIAPQGDGNPLVAVLVLGPLSDHIAPQGDGNYPV